MKIKQQSIIRSMSAAKLRRARRLYAYLIFDEAMENNELLPYFAAKAIKRGLWAESTGFKGAMFGLMSQFHRLDRKTNPLYWSENCDVWGGTWGPWWNSTDFDPHKWSKNTQHYMNQ